MANSMTASKAMSRAQAHKVGARLEQALLKHQRELDCDSVQQVLEKDRDLDTSLLSVFLKHVERFSGMIVRIANVTRSRTPEEVFSATGRIQYIDSEVATTMPKGEGDTAEVIFFKVNCPIRTSELMREYDLRDLKPADPYSLTAVNEADPSFADEHSNATVWKDAKGRWCHVSFNHWSVDERYVGVYVVDTLWSAGWLFAGLRK